MASGKWRIEPKAARAVTQKARGEEESVTAALRRIQRAIDDACDVLGAAASSSHGALRSLREDPFGVEVTATTDHIESAAGQVDGSIMVFELGDLQMADGIDGARSGSPLDSPWFTR